MKKLVMAAIMLAGMLASTSGAANLVTNGDFEAADTIDGTTISGWDNSTAAWTLDNSHSWNRSYIVPPTGTITAGVNGGSQFVRATFAASAEYMTQSNIAVEANTSYTLSFDAICPRDELSIAYTGLDYAFHNGTPSTWVQYRAGGIGSSLGAGILTESWTTYSTTINAGANTTLDVRVCLRSSDDVYGVDNVLLELVIPGGTLVVIQ